MKTLTRVAGVFAAVISAHACGFAQIINGTPGQAWIDSVVEGPGGTAQDFGPVSIGGGHDTIFDAAPPGLISNRIYDPQTDETAATFNLPQHATILGWGGDDSDIGPNIILFTPVPSFSVTRGQEFVIGYLTLFNGSSNARDFVDSFRLGIDTGVTAPSFAGLALVPFTVRDESHGANQTGGSTYSFGSAFGQSVQLSEGAWGSVEVLGRFNSPLTVTRFGHEVDFSVLGDGSFTVSPNDNAGLRLAPVPEPSTYGMLAAFVLALAVGAKRVHTSRRQLLSN